MGMDWFGDDATRQLVAHLGSRVALALTHPLERMRVAVATQGPPRSSPGEPPHRDSGDLHESLYVDARPSAMYGEIGSTEPQAVYTEVGTGRMAARPWFLPSIIDTVDAMAGELGG